MISLSNIHYRYPGTSAPAVLQGIDLTIREGEYVLLCGRSGSGKSTFGYLLNGLIPHFFEGHLEGTVTIHGQDTKNRTVADLLSTVGMVFQNADAQLFNSTVESEMAFGLESLGFDPRKIAAKIEKTAEDLAIIPLLDRSPMSLSGGEKRLVAIASVLCLDPPVMVLDEPLAHLDWEGAKRIREVLRDLHRKGKTLLVIEQRMSRTLDDASRCVILGHGEIFFDGPPDAAWPVLDQEHLVPRYPLRRTVPLRSRETLLQVTQISHSIDRNPVLRDVSLEIKQGEILAVVGKNGAGKTTLLKHFNALFRPEKGTVLYGGEDIRSKAPSEMAAHVGISFQNANDQFFKNTVRDELMVGVRPGMKDAEEWVDELCCLFDLRGLLDLSPYRLSEGQKKRVAIASVLVTRPRMLALDEPTIGQDGYFLETLAGLLVSLREKGLTIVIVTHDLDFAQATADRLIILDKGKVTGMAIPGTPTGNAVLAEMGLRGPGEPVFTRGAANNAG